MASTFLVLDAAAATCLTRKMLRLIVVLLEPARDKSESEGVSGENPTKLDAKDQEEAVDMAGRVFMRLDTAACK